MLVFLQILRKFPNKVNAGAKTLVFSAVGYSIQERAKRGMVNIVITYSGGIKTLYFTTLTDTVINNLGMASVSGGTYTFTKLVKDLRGTTDAPIPTSGTSGSVALTVSAAVGNGQGSRDGS